MSRHHVLVLGLIGASLVTNAAGADPVPTSATATQPAMTPCKQARTLDVGPSGRGTFRSISAALDEAARESLCGVTIAVAAGTYSESFAITRHTEIRGHAQSDVIITGSARSVGAHILKIRDVTFRGTPAPAALYVEGSAVELTNVRIERASDFGVKQRGGKISLTGVEVRETKIGPAVRATNLAGRGRALPMQIAAGSPHVATAPAASSQTNTGIAAALAAVEAEALRGTGVYADGGATVDIASVTANANVTHGFVVRGGGTKAKGVKLFVDDTSHDSHIAALTAAGLLRVGAVGVYDGATLLVDTMRIARSDLGGLVVDHNARAHVKSGTFTATRTVDKFAGINLWVADGGALELHGFTSSYAAQAGFWVEGGYFYATAGEIHHNFFFGVTGSLPTDFKAICLEPPPAGDINAHDDQYGEQFEPIGGSPVAPVPIGPSKPPGCKTVPFN